MEDMKSVEDGEFEDEDRENEDDEAKFHSVYDELTYISDRKLDEITLASSIVGTVVSGAAESEYSKTCAHLELKLAKH